MLSFALSIIALITIPTALAEKPDPKHITEMRERGALERDEGLIIYAEDTPIGCEYGDIVYHAEVELLNPDFTTWRDAYESNFLITANLHAKTNKGDKISWTGVLRSSRTDFSGYICLPEDTHVTGVLSFSARVGSTQHPVMTWGAHGFFNTDSEVDRFGQFDANIGLEVSPIWADPKWLGVGEYPDSHPELQFVVKMGATRIPHRNGYQRRHQ